MKYSQEEIDKITKNASIVKVIGMHTKLFPGGRGYMGRCPFPDHKEKTPSFSVNEIKSLYYCFGCKKNGNLMTFLQSFSGMTSDEAIEYLKNLDDTNA